MLRINALMVAEALEAMGLAEVRLYRRWYSGGRYQTGWQVTAIAVVAGEEILVHVPTEGDAACLIAAYSSSRRTDGALHSSAGPDGLERGLGGQEAGIGAVPELEA